MNSVVLQSLVLHTKLQGNLDIHIRDNSDKNGIFDPITSTLTLGKKFLQNTLRCFVIMIRIALSSMIGT